ncbi:methionyl-tRNA formyltransferase [Candidatus Parcubacteria bacterium]|nr:methionyl-tRNA formyltransferase [Candidatus Parcubacteria bacterium]
MTKKAMTHKFVYFGTPYVSSDTLEILVAHGFVPSLVVTSPDAPKGRGMEVTPSETKMFAQNAGLSVIAPEKHTADVVDDIKKIGATYALVVAYGKILPQSLIDAFPLGILNIHYSLLPKYRGASPVECALLHGDTVTGVAIQKMVKELDAGDILAIKEVPIEPHETARELRPRLVKLGAELLVDVLPSFEDGTIALTPQDHSQATRCGKIAKEEGLLDFSEDAKTNWNKYRAYAESPGTYFFLNGKRVKIKTARFENGQFIPLRVVPEGKREMDYVDFVK